MLRHSTFAFTSQLSNGSFAFYHLGEIIPTFYTASNSVILSLASYITWKFPNLKHPNYMDFKLDGNFKQKKFPCSHLSLHPLFEAWSDTLCKSIFQGNAGKVEETLYILVPVPQFFVEELEKMSWSPSIYQEKVSIQKVFNIPKIQYKEKRIILMNFALSQLRQNQLTPKINIPALLMGTIFDNQKWSFYCALKGQIPEKQVLVSADTIILPGSSNSVLHRTPQIELFVSELKQAYEQNKKLKLLGICYGHQLIAYIHGAKVQRKKRIQGHQVVSFNKKTTSKYDFLEDITQHIKNQFIMPEHHEDYVENIPKGFDLIAASNSCFVEAMVKEDGRAFSLQSHPQYFSQYSETYRTRMQNFHSNEHVCFDLAIGQNQLETHHESCNVVRRCIKNFIKSEIKIEQK